MGETLIAEFLAGDSTEIRDLASNEAALVGFFTLLKGIDDLPEVSHRFYESVRSLYQVTALKHSVDELVAILSDFFGDPVKMPGRKLPVNLRFDPVVKYLGGVRNDQILFLKKLKTGSFYGALWPWQRDKKKIEILLGFHSASMIASDYKQLEILTNKFLSQKKIGFVSDVGGQIHGISLPSFLQMSEMEGATYTLNVSSGDRIGYLYVDGGSLVAARFNGHTGNEAAYRIISWDNTAIQIEPAEPDRVREIHDPLMHVMMESLKIKDESGDDLLSLEPKTKRFVPPPPPIEDALLLDSLSVEEEGRLKKKSAEVLSASVKKKPRKEPSTIPSPQSEEYKPLEKRSDRSIGRQHRMSRTQKLIVVLGVVILFAIAVTGGGQLMKKIEASQRYEQLQADLAASDALDARIVLLMKYVSVHPEDTHRSELERQLAQYYTEIEMQDYENTVADANSLPIDEQFEKRALSLYTAFLTRYPQSIYADAINEAIRGIGQLLGTASFENLKKVAGTDFLARYEAYRSYLEQFPQSEERKAVERMMTDLVNETVTDIEKQVTHCETRQNWDPCIVHCDQFLSAFTSPAATVKKVERMRSILEDNKDLFDLTAKASLAGDDYGKAMRIYTDYLEMRPETSQKEMILQRIDALREDQAKQAAWMKTKTYSEDPANDIISRVQRLDIYLGGQVAPPYDLLAGKLRKQLEPEHQAAIRSQREKETRHREAVRQKIQAQNRVKEIQRIQQIRDRMIGKLQPVETRYDAHLNGTVTDRVTGLTWCLLDSYLVLNDCISYETAKAYVQSLDTGGYSDWRLPTAGELATLYKNSPFFPSTGAPWYWTSESFARGYHRVVDVVTPEQETVFKRMSIREDSYGAVRAVR